MVSGSGKPEISCRVINSLIRYAESRGADIDAIVARSGVSKLYLTDPNNWVSDEFEMDFCEHLAQHLGEEDIMYKAALLTPATNVLGGIELLVRLLGSPRPCYSMIPEYSKYFERISEFTVELKGKHSALVTMRRTMVHPKSKHACHYARGILAAIPTVWRLPPATVLEKRCSVPVDRAGTIDGKYYRVAEDGTVLQFESQAHDVPEHGQAVGKLDEHGTFEVGGITYGAEACVYEVSWTEPRAWYRRVMEFFVRPRSFLKEEITELERDKKLLQEKCEEVLRLSQELSQLSVTDELTGLYNRRHFYEVLESEMRRTRRYGGSFSLIMFDLDGLKQYNDRFGHTNGDAVLRCLAQTIKSILRNTDTAFRYGGDEFAIILPATDADIAKNIVGRLRSEWLQVLRAPYLIVRTPIEFSTGIAQFPEDAETADGLVFLADTALYRAKRQGGYKCALVSELVTLETEASSLETLDPVYALATAVDSRDPHTYGHSKRVATIAEMIGEAIGLSGNELADLRAACLLHDIGKVGIPNSLLTKPGKPTDEEWRVITKHCAEGARIVSCVRELAPLAPMILHHHEWYDGTGYPEGLKGEDIPLGARIIGIADAYDTMTTPRPYGEVMSQEEALEELRRCSSTQFDPELVEALCWAAKEAAGQD